jgi:hypothetical protein
MTAPRINSRTQALHYFRAAVSGPVGGLALPGFAAGETTGWAIYERKWQKQRTCRDDERRCGQRCIPHTNCCADNECASCESCQQGLCVSRSRT